jgi:hypothetical protein
MLYYPGGWVDGSKGCVLMGSGGNSGSAASAALWFGFNGLVIAYSLVTGGSRDHDVNGTNGRCGK